MVPIGAKSLEGAIANHADDIKKIVQDAQLALANVRLNFANTFDQAEQAYLDQVISFFNEDGFISYDQANIQSKANLLPALPLRTILSDANGQPAKSLGKHILDALDYEGLRKTFYPRFFKSLGVNACVYCNSQPALTVYKVSPKGRSRSVKAKYQLDHYIPKDNYPFLSICFYNLYPVCGICNNAKKESSVEFELYGDQAPKPYYFELSQASLAKYLISGVPGQLEINFHDPDKGKFTGTDVKTFQEVFNIQGIYETQRDVAEELIIKSQVYKGSYKRSLQTAFGKVIKGDDISNRVLVGNYTDLNDIHKRPMAKFMQDIARQLELIK